MKPEILIIQRPDFDSPVFLSIALKVLGRSLASAVDASSKQLSAADCFLSYLSAMRSSEAGIDLNPELLTHVTYSVLVVANELDILDMAECAGGIPFVTAVTVVRGVLLAVMTGNLAQWQLAVIAGTAPEMPTEVRHAFNEIHTRFQSEGINLWANFRRRPATDQVTYLLEDKRG